MRKEIIYNRINIQPSTLPIYTLMTSIDNVNSQGLDISPDYQRGLIWSQEYKEQLILSLILQYPIGNIVLNQLGHPNQKNAIQELVDGKQRLSTIHSFMNNHLIIKGEIAQLIIKTIANILKDNTDPQLNKLLKRKTFKFKDLPTAIQNNINAYNIAIYTMNSADTTQIREYFKVLQNQDRLRAGEIINSMPDNDLYSYFTEINEGFLEKINYTNLKRADLEKLYYSMCSVILEKLPLNAQDKEIIKFIEKLDVSNIHESKLKQISSMNTNLLYIINNADSYEKFTMSKRTLKLILGISAFCDDFFKINTTSKVNFIMEFSTKLSAFNSSDSDEKSFTKYYPDEYLPNTKYFIDHKAPQYRKIYNTFSKTTPTENVKKNMRLCCSFYQD